METTIMGCIYNNTTNDIITLIVFICNYRGYIGFSVYGFG